MDLALAIKVSRLMCAGLAMVLLSVSQKAQSSASTKSRSVIANIKRAAPVISVASKGWKWRPGVRTSIFHLSGNRNASHPVNAILNYAYTVLQSEIQISAISDGYDPTIGIMHEGSDGSAAFVFDLMEPRRLWWTGAFWNSSTNVYF